ncbi:DUF418 domain-containing protein [Salibacterium sp. K-3]
MNAAEQQERIQVLDVLRGFALFGILIANMAAFKTAFFQLESLPGASASFSSEFINQWMMFFIDLFVTGKFYPLFSFLFGLGFFLFYERLNNRGLDAGKLYRRRLFFLLCAGMTHLIFIWSGDILHTYAAAGLLLLPFIHRSARVVLTWAVTLLLLTSVFIAFVVTTGNFYTTAEEGYRQQALNRAAEAEAIYSGGSYAEILQFRLAEEVPFLLSNLIITVPQILGLFLLGLYIGKKGWIQYAGECQKWWKKIMFTSFAGGGLLSLLYAALLHQLLPLPLWLADGLAQGLNIIAGPLMMLFYASFFVSVVPRHVLQVFFRPLAAAGQMALTNYLLQSLICVFIFYGFGLQLFGTMDAASGFICALVIFSGQLVLSTFWMSNYKQGPLEKLWRIWIYRPVR